MKRFPTKTVVIALLALVLIVGGAIALLSSPDAADDGTADASASQAGNPVTTVKPSLTVSATRAQTVSMPIRLTANGNIAAWQEAIIGSEAHGLRLAEVLVNVGDQVRAGDVLATFANEAVAADVGQARAALMEAQANAAEAAANADRARSLQTTGALSEQQINQYLTAEQTAKARVEAAKATLAAQQVRMKNVQVLAPDSGIISARSATVGAVVPAGTELFRMIRRGRLEWRAEVTPSELGRIKAGVPATVVAVNGARLAGKVRMVGPTVDPQSRNAIVYVDLAAAAEDAPPAIAGMFARGEFDLGTSTALTVPQQAVVLRDGFSYVFRLDAENRVQQLKVRTGRRLGDRVEILEGLTADASVVDSGAGFLNDGDLVRVVASGATGNDATAQAPAAN